MTNMTRRSAGTAALMLLCTAGLALAQRPGGPPMDPQQMADRQLAGMKDRLKLTPDQEEKLKPILLDSAKQMAEMRKKMTPGEPPSEEAMTEMRKSRETNNKKVADVLTDDQKKEYEKMLSERRGMGGPGGPGGPGGRRERPPQQ